MDVKWNILLKTKEVCKQREFDQNIFDSRAPPSKMKREIREEYMKMLSSFLSVIPLFMFEDNNNSKKYPQEKVMKTLRIIEKDYEKTFGDYLEGIKRRYPEDIWKIKSK